MSIQTKGQPAEVDDAAVNPMGTDGFEFVEYTAPDPAALARLFEQMGFTAMARHRSPCSCTWPSGASGVLATAISPTSPSAPVVGLR